MSSASLQFNELDISVMLSLWLLLHGLFNTTNAVSFIAYGLMIGGVDPI